MQNWIAITTFVVCFLLKATSIYGAESAPATAAETQSKVLIEQPAVAAPAASTTTTPPPMSALPIQNNITVNAPPAVAYKGSGDVADASTVLGAKASSSERESKVALIPMIGGGDYVTRWADNTTDRYSLGLALDFQASRIVSIELEGGYSKYTTTYSYMTQFGSAQHSHDFNQFLIGLNGKIYVVRSLISPYLGAGIAGVYYENMDHGPYYPGRRYNQWIGSGQLLAGLDVDVAEQIAVGIRGSYLHPLFNRPQTQDNGFNSTPFYEDAGLMNTGSYRILGTMSVRF